jgi:hypothetical protein
MHAFLRDILSFDCDICTIEWNVSYFEADPITLAFTLLRFSIATRPASVHKI